jgi:hypothetical protein
MLRMTFRSVAPFRIAGKGCLSAKKRMVCIVLKTNQPSGEIRGDELYFTTNPAARLGFPVARSAVVPEAAGFQ